MQANVLMTLPEFVDGNREALGDRVRDLDDQSSLLSIDIDKPVSFVYRDPRGRFELVYPSIGTPANFTSFMLTRSTGQGTGTLAVQQMEFVLSDGASLSTRVDEVSALRRYLMGAEFVPVSYDGFEVMAGETRVTTLDGLVKHADEIESSVIGGLSVFTLQRDEILFGVSILPQLSTAKRDDYTIHFFVAEKVKGVEY